MEEIHNILTTTIDHCIPYKECTVNYKHVRKAAWLTASIKISIDRNKKLYAKMLKGECTKNKYTHYNNVLCKTIRHAKLKFYQDMYYEYRSQTKKLWGLINEIARKNNNKSGLIEYLKINEVREYSAQKISKSFAKYFAGVGKQFALKIPKPVKLVTDYLKFLQSSQSSLFLSPTCEEEIKKIVSTLPSKTSSGHDNISYVLLKEIIDQLAPVLMEVFNKSMTMGEFPSIMKLAEVEPLYKGKEHYLENKYRPISLLTTISKILEKKCIIMFIHFYTKLDKFIRTNMASKRIIVVSMP